MAVEEVRGNGVFELRNRSAVLDLFAGFSAEELEAAEKELDVIEQELRVEGAVTDDRERPAWLDGKTPPKTKIPSMSDYRRALKQFGAKDSEEFRQRYLQGFSDDDMKWIKPEAIVDPVPKQQPQQRTPKRIQPKKEAPIQLAPTVTVQRKVPRNVAAAQALSNKKGMDQLWYPVPITGPDRDRLAKLSKKEDPRYETLETAIRSSGLGYSNEAIAKVLTRYSDEYSLNGSREQVTEGLQQKGPYTIFLSNDLRRDLYRADLELKGDTAALKRFDFETKVEDERARIEKQFAEIEPQNNLHAAFLALAKENAMKAAIDRITEDPNLDLREGTEQQKQINAFADGVQSSFVKLMDANPLYRYLPDSVKQQISDYGIGLLRGGVQLAGTIKGASDFVADAAQDLILSGVEKSGLDQKLGIDTKTIRRDLEASRKKDAQLWSDLANAQTARIGRGELGYQTKRELGLRTTPFDIPNWAVRAGEITTKAAPYLAVGLATGGASLPVQVGVNAAFTAISSGGEIYNQTRNRPEALKAAAWGAAQGAVMPLSNRLGYSGDLAASAAFDYITTKIRDPNASDDQIIFGMITQAASSGAFHTGSKIFRALEAKTGRKLTPDTAKLEYQRLLETDLPVIKQEVAASSKAQTEEVIQQVQREVKQSSTTAKVEKKLIDPKYAKALEPQIMAAVAAFKKGDYQTAQKLLTDRDVADRIGVTLDRTVLRIDKEPSKLTKEEIESMTTVARMNSMSWEDRKVSIVDAIYIPKEGFEGLATSADIPSVGKQLTPIMLEEWMHQLQTASGRPISKLTSQYLKEKGLKWSDEYHEMDIIAAFYEWGFPVDELGTVRAYPERKEFQDWYRARGGR